MFKHGDESAKRRPSLNDLCKSVLGYELREKGAPHNCFDDTCAAMKLVVAKLEKGFDDVLPYVAQDIVICTRLRNCQVVSAHNSHRYDCISSSLGTVRLKFRLAYGKRNILSVCSLN